MKYLLMIYGNPALEAVKTQEQNMAELQEYGTFSAEVTGRGLMVSGEALQAVTSATSVRVRDGKTVITDGPFAETHEVLGGLYVLNCKDLDEAIEMAAKIPGARTGTIEIRPVQVWS